MKIIKSKMKKFLEKPDILNGVLIYGNSIGIIDFLTNEIISTIVCNKYTIYILDFLTINKSPNLLLSELINISIFSKRKLFKIINVSENISKELKNILNDNIHNHYVIMIANDLSKKSTTRIYIENSKIFGTISCYKNNIKNDLQNILPNYFKKNNIKYTNESFFYLESYLSSGELSIYLELEKLILYLGEKKNLELKDVKFCLSCFYDNNTVLDDLYSSIVNRDIKNFIKVSDTLILKKNFSPIILIRILSSYFVKFEKVLLLIQSGMSEENAINQLEGELFFNQLKNFKLNLKKLQLSKLKKILERLINLEIFCKKTNLDHKMIFQNIIQLFYI